MSRRPESPSLSEPKLRTALKVIIVLGTVALAEAFGLIWLWRSTAVATDQNGFIIQASSRRNLIQEKFPEVNFAEIYPGFSPAQIDQLQRESLGLRYTYSPFVEFELQPVAGRFLTILPAGFRKGRIDGPWPPSRQEFVIFVFGGSTTLGFGLPDEDTVVSALEAAFAKKFPGRTVRCYNFGRGYYFSAQERALFESLLLRGIIPNAAVFIDGLNEFIYYDGVPQFTPTLFSFTAPDLPSPQRPELTNDSERASAVEQMIDRYRTNIRLTEAMARAHGVQAVFIGQPVPFLDFPMNASTYPFRSTFAEHKLAGWGYDRFKQAARESRFGESFVWCGNAFAQANRVMYADSIHYSPLGAEVLARCIADRVMEVSLLR